MIDYRLTGISPFAAREVEEIIEKNKICEIDYPKELWKEVSLQALDLVVKMTDRDQYKRPSAKECLQHEWLAIKLESAPVLTRVIENLNKCGTEYSAGINNAQL